MAPEQKKILIITSSCGGGLLQAALAKEQEERERDPSALIIKRDLMREWHIKPVGWFGIWSWDRAQRKGNVKMLEWLINCQPANDIMFWPFLFIAALRTLFKEKVDRVFDTQPVGTSAILAAIRAYNYINKKNLILEKVVVDLPTKWNTSFLGAVKRIGVKNRALIRLITIAPLLEKGQTLSDFWQTECNLPEEQIIYQHYVIRENFRKLQGKELTGQVTLKARLGNLEEKTLLSKTLKKGSVKATFDGTDVLFQINKKEKVFAILLGSQPSFQGTLGYVREMIRLAKEEGANKTPAHLFILCGEHREGREDTLFYQISQIAIRMRSYPSHFTIIPLSFQSDEFIAPLFARCNATCTKCGGQTAMELMCLSQGEMWIHSEAKKTDSFEELLKGIPGWEAGSARYLAELHGAKVVTPKTFAPHARQVFRR